MYKGNSLSYLTIASGLVFLLCLPLTVQSAPHHGDLFKLKQPDGSRVEVQVWGDEYYQFVESLDGYTLVRDPQTGWICYATLTGDGNELISTGVVYQSQSPSLPQEGLPLDGPAAAPATKASVPPAGVQAHLRLPAAVVRPLALSKKAELDQGATLEPWPVQTPVPADANGVAMPAAPAAAFPAEVIGLTIVVQFSDERSPFTQQQISDYANKPGYKGFNNNGSVRDYFFDASYGKLTYTNMVPAIYTMQNPKGYYDSPDGEHVGDLVIEALDHLVETGFNFGQLSVDSNGYLLAVNIFYAGYPDWGWAKGLWPHSGGIGGYPVAAGIRVSRYQMTNIGDSLSIGTFCHENGHMVCRWPDLYDYGYESTGVGGFCLMAYGGGNNPVLANPYFRARNGWENYIELNGLPDKNYTHTANSNTTYRYVNPANSQEYFLIDSRIKTGRHQNLPDDGVIIWHVDERGSNDNEQMTPQKHYLVSVEQADGLFDLEKNRNYGGANDCFDLTHNLFDGSTTPNSNWWSGAASGLYVKILNNPGPTTAFSTARKYSGGSGEPLDPYQILLVQDLQELNQTPGDYGKCFMLMSDLDLSAITFTQAVIAGDGQSAFAGVFDGNDHVISNLTIKPVCGGSVSGLGLFGLLDANANITHLGLEQVKITMCPGGESAGALAGSNQGQILECYSTGTITSGAGSKYAGGLCGWNQGRITNCYSSCSVTAGATSKSVGGFCGGNSGMIFTCYSAGQVAAGQGSSYIGGFCGEKEGEGETIASFWDQQTSGQTVSSGGLGLNTDQMKNLDTYLDPAANWNISANNLEFIWVLPMADYPRLSWQAVFPIFVDGLPIWNKSIKTNSQRSFNFTLFALASGSTPWKVTANCPWIKNIDPAAGASTGPGHPTQISFIVDTTGLNIGYHQCTINLSDTKSSKTLPVQIFVYDPFVNLEDLRLLEQYWSQTGCDTKPCGITDWFKDGVIDILDINLIATNWLENDMLIDCDGNGQADELEIAANAALDCNQNGLLDSCEIAWGCAHDINHNQIIDLCELPDGPDNMRFAYIPGGAFNMGDALNVGRANEKPVHAVTLAPYYISQYEINCAQYAAWLNAARQANKIKVSEGVIYGSNDVTKKEYPYFRTAPMEPGSPIRQTGGLFEVVQRDGQDMSSYPVNGVSWYGANAFCAFYGYKLPTEAQWEFAAHGGMHLLPNRYPWGANTIDCSLANYTDTAPCNPFNLTDAPRTSPVGHHGPQGLYKLSDMAGNVWEWCSDWDGPYSTDTQNDPAGPASGASKVIRGGSWGSQPDYCRNTYRDFSTPVITNNSIGFRVIVDMAR